VVSRAYKGIDDVLAHEPGDASEHDRVSLSLGVREVVRCHVWLGRLEGR
jgi:hypothetical protein